MGDGMRRCLSAMMLLCVGGLLSGCGLLFIALADAITPEPVQSVDILWAKRPNFCASVVYHAPREAFLMRGHLDSSSYEPIPALPLWVRQPSREDHVHGQHGLDMSTAPQLVRRNLTYVYSEARPLWFEATRGLPPMPGTEGEDFAGAMKQAWRSTLYRLNSDGTLSRECVFVTRRMWFNFAI